MDINKIHFIREVLKMDHGHGETPTMQFSCDNASYLRPTFLFVPPGDQEEVRELYLELGGGRLEGRSSGSIVIIPNRSFWARMRRPSPDEAQVMNGEGPARLGNRALGERVDASE